MASLTDLSITVSNTANRQSQIFLRVWTGSSFEFRNVGRVVDSSFTAEPITSDADQDGRESAQVFDITVGFSMMQASETELSLLEELSMPTDTANFQNGHSIYVSGTNQISESTLNSNLDGSGNPDYSSLHTEDPRGIYFKNVLLKPTAEINLMGENSMIPIEFTGRVPNDVFSGFDDTSASDANHVVISPD
jgi:hypothetical protein